MYGAICAASTALQKTQLLSAKSWRGHAGVGAAPRCSKTSVHAAHAPGWGS
jgi:hypothetical protein